MKTLHNTWMGYVNVILGPFSEAEINTAYTYGIRLALGRMECDFLCVVFPSVDMFLL